MSVWQPQELDGWLRRLEPRDLLLLQSIEQFRLLSTNHIRRLHFTAGHVSTLSGTRTAVRVLGRLEAWGLLTRLARQVGGAQRGSAALVWQLSALGERLLRARRGDPIRRRYQEPSLAFSAHQLDVSELAVRVHEAARAQGFEILSLDAEPASWRSFINAGGSVSWVKPDLAVITADATSETHTWVEVDRATEHIPAVLRKCALYQRYFATGTEQAANGVFPAVVWSVPDTVRGSRIADAIRDDPALDETLFLVRTSDDVMEVLVPPE